SFPLRSGANNCTQRLMEFFFGVVRRRHDSLRLRPALDMGILRQTDQRSNGAAAPAGDVGARSISAITLGLRRRPARRAGGYLSSRLRATRTRPEMSATTEATAAQGIQTAFEPRRTVQVKQTVPIRGISRRSLSISLSRSSLFIRFH